METRMEKFNKMCKTCIFDACELKCKGCHSNGYSRDRETHYCKCLDEPSKKEKRCYYYRKNRK